MPRPENEVRGTSDAATDFARQLRAARRDAAMPTYRQLAQMTGLAAPTLSKAASGKKLPTQQIAIAYAVACGQSRALWESRWLEAKRRLEVERSRSEAARDVTDTQNSMAIAESLRDLTSRVRQLCSGPELTFSQRGSNRTRKRPRVPGSTRHLADVITRGQHPTSAISHVHVARALNGNPRYALNEVLVVSIVRACHELCGIAFSEEDRRSWHERIAAADR
ncbi:helix-turn-helix domain-containing protein [Glycomyces mayteni]|uniref:Helix-turn-helix domain-containing protein n=1 Tax=Glycomyces mayteni TaxID=543887 RepID=A0ABW2D6X3_9ACTN|nr:hypothetical protein GCM10025732_55490 [Glycomyces mayteni]